MEPSLWHTSAICLVAWVDAEISSPLRRRPVSSCPCKFHPAARTPAEQLVDIVCQTPCRYRRQCICRRVRHTRPHVNARLAGLAASHAMYRQSLLKLEPYTQFIDIPSAMTLVGRFSATESMNELQLQRRCSPCSAGLFAARLLTEQTIPGGLPSTVA
jgi:hypothetical protein